MSPSTGRSHPRAPDPSTAQSLDCIGAKDAIGEQVEQASPCKPAELTWLGVERRNSGHGIDDQARSIGDGVEEVDEKI